MLERKTRSYSPGFCQQSQQDLYVCETKPRTTNLPSRPQHPATVGRFLFVQQYNTASTCYITRASSGLSFLSESKSHNHRQRTLSNKQIKKYFFFGGIFKPFFNSTVEKADRKAGGMTQKMNPGPYSQIHGSPAQPGDFLSWSQDNRPPLRMVWICALRHSPFPTGTHLLPTSTLHSSPPPVSRLQGVWS